MTQPSVVDPDVEPVFAIAATALAAVVADFTAAGVDLPARRFVAPGAEPAFDCALLAVTVVSVTVGLLGELSARPVTSCPRGRYMRLRVDLMRQVPTSSRDAVRADALTAAARVVLRDVHLLERALTGNAQTIIGRGDYQRGRGLPHFLGDVTPVGPEGGLAGCRADLDVPV